MKVRILVAVMSLTALGVSGCSEVSAEDVAKTTSERTSALVTEVGSSAQWFDQLSAFSDLANSFEQVRSSFSSVPLYGGEGDSQVECPAGEIGCPPESGESFAGLSAPSEAQVNETNALLQKFIKERIFTEANVEDADSDSAVFLIEGEDLCTDGTVPAEPSCVKAVNDIQIRIRATPVSDKEIHLALLLGPSKTETLTLKLGDGMAAVEINLAGIKSSVERIASLMGEEAEFPNVMQGKIEFRLQKNGEKDFTLGASVLAPIRIEDGVAGEVTTFTTAARSPVGALHLDGIAKQLRIDLDLGETELTVPYSDVAVGQTMTYHLSGASFSLAAGEGDQELGVMHLGLGDAQSWVKLDGTTLLTGDLNELSGRHFDIKFRKDVDGEMLTTVLPEFNLVTKFFFKPLKTAAEATVPSFYEDETYKVKLIGDGAPVLKPIKADATKSFPGGIKVVKGSLSLETSKAGVDAVVVGEGQCLVEKVPTEGSHPLLGTLQSVACP